MSEKESEVPKILRDLRLERGWQVQSSLRSGRNHNPPSASAPEASSEIVTASDHLSSTTMSGHPPLGPNISAINGTVVSQQDQAETTLVDQHEGMDAPIPPSFIETPIGEGTNSRLRSSVRIIVGSEEVYEEEEYITTKYTRIEEQVAEYERNLENKNHWVTLIESEYNRILKLIEEFCVKAVMVSNDDFVIKGKDLKELLHHARIAWEQKAESQQRNPELSRINLTSKLSTSSPLPARAATQPVSPLIDNVFRDLPVKRVPSLSEELQAIADAQQDNPVSELDQATSESASNSEVTGELQDCEIQLLSLTGIFNLQEKEVSQEVLDRLQDFDRKLNSALSKPTPVDPQTVERISSLEGRQLESEKSCDELKEVVSGLQNIITNLNNKTDQIGKDVTKLKDDVYNLGTVQDNQGIAHANLVTQVENVNESVVENKGMLSNTGKSLEAVQTKLDQFSRESKLSIANIDALKLSIKDHQRKLTACKHAASTNLFRAEPTITSQRQISGHISQNASCGSVMANNGSERSTMIVQDHDPSDRQNASGVSEGVDPGLTVIPITSQPTNSSTTPISRVPQSVCSSQAGHYPNTIAPVYNQRHSVVAATSSYSHQGSLVSPSDSQSVHLPSAVSQAQGRTSVYQSVSQGNSLAATSSNALVDAPSACLAHPLSSTQSLNQMEPISASFNPLSDIDTLAPTDTAAGAMDSEFLILENQIIGLTRLINSKIKTRIDSSASELVIREAKNKDLPTLDRRYKELYSNLVNKYLKHPQRKPEVTEKASTVLERALKWIQSVEEAYTDQEIYSVDNGKSPEVSLKTFSGAGPQVVYEFLDDFERKFKGVATSKEKAEQLYNNYLADDIKTLTSSISTSYPELKAWLIKKYGDVMDTTDCIIAQWENHSKPKEKDYKARAEYFFGLVAMIQRINKMKDRKEIDEDELDSYITDKPFFKRLMKLLPPIDVMNLSRIFMKKAISDTHPHGEYALKHYLEYCSEEAHAAKKYTNADSDGRDVIQIETAQKESRSKQKTSKPTVQVAAKQADKDWYNKNLKKPCPIATHDHEVGTCEEFFSMTPDQRRKTARGKMCYTCGGPRDKCQNQSTSKCRNEQENMPIICQSCVAYVKRRELAYSPYNMLFCSNPTHTKPSALEVSDQISKYFPMFDQQRMLNRMVLHYSIGVHSTSLQKGKAGTKTKTPEESEKDVAVDSSTGVKTKLDPTKLIPESSDPPIYLLQHIKIGKSDAICFFDTGANIHLIDGPLAEKENLEVLTQKPSEIHGAGGIKVVTEYGMYRLNLGPTEKGMFHELSCHGIDPITGTFDKHSFDQVNQETRQSELLPSDILLPSYAGGSKVHLLIGIKDAAAHPVLIDTLPSGLGVYRSPFKDIFGSRICYGGTHESFLKNMTSNGNHHTAYFLNQLRLVANEVSDTIQAIEEASNELLPDIFASDKPKDQVFQHSWKDLQVIHTDLAPILAAGDSEPSADQYDNDRSYIPTFKNSSSPNGELLNASGQTFYHCCSDISPTEDLLDTNSVQVISRTAPQTVSAPGAHKAMIPMSRLRELVDQDDVGDLVTYRCPTCSKCVKCKESGKVKAINMQEAAEQLVIEKSVTLDLERGKVFVDLPFVKNPIEALSKRHSGGDNYRQAIQVYKQQCRKQSNVKAAMVEVHKDLVSKGFMSKVSDLDPETQEIINVAPFRHFYPWRIVYKEDSVSTPVRIVVDPTMTGLNFLLAKGENHLGSMIEILISNRLKQYAWSSDISKMYNQLILKKESLPYSLFLFSDKMDAEVPPEIWSMCVAWYGVVPTGNQAGYAIELLVKELGDQYPSAEDILLLKRYVDDILAGADTEEQRKEQIKQVQEILAKAGFKLKFVALSGHIPCEKASSDGSTMKVLGYSWMPEQDFFSPGMGEINFNKKVRGAKQPNKTPNDTVEKVKEAMKEVRLTRKMCVARVAEIYDPLGLWESVKLQFKLDLSQLNSLQWDEELQEQDQEYWKQRLLQLVDLPKVKVKRSVIPENAVNPENPRILCLADAAVNAGGAAIYIGFELPNGSFSCDLLTAKSRLLKSTIPRNELSAIMLMTELAFIVSRALKGKISDVIYLTDSTIALSWVHNVSKRLRLFVHNRVESIRRMIEWTTGLSEDQPLPLFHIEGERNLADLLTKKHDLQVSEVDMESEWQKGLDWMKLPTNQMPLTRYSDLTAAHDSQEAKKELFQEPFELTAQPESIHQITHVSGAQFQKVYGPSDVSALVFSSVHPEVDLVKTSPPVDCSLSNIQSLGQSGTDNVDEWPQHLEVFKETDWHAQILELFYIDEEFLQDSTDTTSSVYSLFAKKPRRSMYMGIDVIGIGWRRTVSAVASTVKCAAKWRRLVIAKSSKDSQTSVTLQRESKFESRLIRQTEFLNDPSLPASDKKRKLISLAEETLFRFDSTEIIAASTPHERRRFKEVDGILYFTGRLDGQNDFTSKDLDLQVFFDSTEFTGRVPVVMADSPLFFAYVVHVHRYVYRHAGVETTLKEVMKKMHVPQHPRKIINKVRKDCTQCKIILKKTIELEFSRLHPSRTMLTPIFYNVQMDIVYGPFKAQPFKRSRTVITIYALVIVCLLSSATNILVLEGLETQDVIAAVERHSMRYGVPGEVFVDNGSQLCALDATKFSLRDADAMLYDSYGMTITVSSPKAHESRGKVESKVKSMRMMLQQLGVNTVDPVSTIQWETTFSKISSMLDDIPLCKGNSSNVSDLGFDILTPNRLKLGRNNNRSLHGTIELVGNALPTDILSRNRKITTTFLQILMDRIHFLSLKKNKWLSTDDRLPQVDDIVLFLFSDNLAITDADAWKLGRVVEVMATRCRIMYPSKSKRLEIPKRKFVERSFRDIVILLGEKDIHLNSSEYFEEITSSEPDNECHE